MQNHDMTQEEAVRALQDNMGRHFRDPALLREALTHSSWGASESERLEFLGDRVVGLIMAQTLYKRFPDEPEGDLAKRHAVLVRGETMAGIAAEADLGAAMIFSDAERAAGGAENDNLLADALEAVIGALYLDQGLEACEDVVLHLWGDRVETMTRPPQDSKTRLQEWAQAQGFDLPHYEIVGRSGPDHAPVFEVEVTVNGHAGVRASASNRRAAEKQAARAFLSQYVDTP